MNRRIAILGGTGFVGCHLARLLTQRGGEVVLFDRAPPNQMGRYILADAPDGVEFVEGDISVPTEVAGLLRRGPFHAIVNLAALQMLDWCNAHPLATYEVNVRGPLVLCDLAAQAAVRRLVHVSSTGALVGTQVDRTDERHPTLDIFVGHPAGHYGASKAMSEIVALAFARVQRLDVIVLRFPSVYGFGSPHQTFVAGAAHAQAAGEPFERPSGADDRRDYLYVRDAAEALVRAIDVPPERLTQRLFFIALGRLHTDRDVVEILRGLEPGARVSIGSGLSPIEVVLDCIRSTYNISAAERELEFTPQFDLKDGLIDYLRWVRGYRLSETAEHS
ncbi:MAG: NAD(P)-dependent oxidoreductase [bacterium]|nr:NAD(P)-dependent oxidoreductase [bacterium]